jgi:hypothetical protein
MILFAFEVSIELGAIAVFAVSTIVIIVWRSAIIVTKQDIMIEWSRKIDSWRESKDETIVDHGQRIRALEVTKCTHGTDRQTGR